jgi:hypothetical protein
VHAGALPDTGGNINAVIHAGRDSYEGSERNGISSRDYGRWERSITFNGAGSYVSQPICPSAYNVNGTSWSGTCRCRDEGSGSVWGSGPYTADSSLCRAARHAGVIGADGGMVSVRPAPGRDSYAGSSRNGVTTSNWGSFGASFTVSQ